MLLAAVGMASARRWGGVLLAPHRAPTVRTGVVTEGWPAQGLSRGRSAPSAVSRSRWSGTQWETLVSYELGPPTEEASLLLLELANIRFASRASLFEPESYFLLGPVGTLMELQTPSVFPGNFRKRKVLGTLCFPFCLPEKYIQAKRWRCDRSSYKRSLLLGQQDPGLRC